MSGAAAPAPAPPSEEQTDEATSSGPSRWAALREMVRRIGRKCVEDDLLGGEISAVLEARTRGRTPLEEPS